MAFWLSTRLRCARSLARPSQSSTALVQKPADTPCSCTSTLTSCFCVCAVRALRSAAMALSVTLRQVSGGGSGMGAGAAVAEGSGVPSAASAAGCSAGNRVSGCAVIGGVFGGCAVSGWDVAPSAGKGVASDCAIALQPANRQSATRPERKEAIGSFARAIIWIPWAYSACRQQGRAQKAATAWTGRPPRHTKTRPGPRPVAFLP